MVFVFAQYHRVTSEDKMRDVKESVATLQLLHPAFEVSFDGDYFAIVGRPNRLASDIAEGVRNRDGPVIDYLQ